VIDSFPRNSWVPEIHGNLTKIISSGPGLACFDFDNTLIRNDFGEKLMDAVITDGMRYLPSDLSHLFRDKDYWKNHTTKDLATKSSLIWEEYAYQFKEFGIEVGYRWTSFLFQGMNQTEFYELSRRTWNLVGQGKTDASVFPQREMLDLIKFLKQHDWEIYIVTASPEQGISAVADHFSVLENHVIGMRQEKSNEGRNLPQIIEPYTYGEGKVKAIQSRIGKMPDLAFGDSFNDYPMLCKATKMAVAIDRGNPEFVEACQKQNIFIQPYFSLN
jgi:phosphoserine phosphatase